VEGEGLNIKFQPPCSAWRHCLPAVRNTNYSELALVHPKFTNTQPLVFRNVYSDLLADAENGVVSVPDWPALSVRCNWAYITLNNVGIYHGYG
jgi:hypothetical protein